MNKKFEQWYKNQYNSDYWNVCWEVWHQLTRNPHLLREDGEKERRRPMGIGGQVAVYGPPINSPTDMETIEELQQQLAEKDAEIQKWKNYKSAKWPDEKQREIMIKKQEVIDFWKAKNVENFKHYQNQLQRVYALESQLTAARAEIDKWRSKEAQSKMLWLEASNELTAAKKQIEIMESQLEDYKRVVSRLYKGKK